MPNPSHPTLVLASNGKSHKTKAELAHREELERSLESGVAMREAPEVKANPRAHKEFQRINKLLKKIAKNDALYQGVVNRYCLLKAECEELEEKRERFFSCLGELDQKMPEDARPMEYYKTMTTMQSQVIACDKQVMAKRKMMLDIEKENIMTIASALRSIPKKPLEDSGDDPMAAVLSRRA